MQRRCKVIVTDADGVSHSTTVIAGSLFEAAAAAVTSFRQESWAAQALTPNAVLNVEVQAPPIVHAVPLKAVERWLQSPSISPKEQAAKVPFRGGTTTPARR